MNMFSRRANQRALDNEASRDLVIQLIEPLRLPVQALWRERQYHSYESRVPFRLPARSAAGLNLLS
jgi:hypothetical protein